MSVTRPARRVNRESLSTQTQTTLVENEFQVVLPTRDGAVPTVPREVFTESSPP